MYIVHHNVDDEKKTVLITGGELTHFMRGIAVENEDEDISITCLSEAKDYLENFCSNLTLETIDDAKINEVFKTLLREYVDSEVVSGEMIHSSKIPLTYSEQETKYGIEKFLDWDGSEETFELKRGRKYWKVK